MIEDLGFFIGFIICLPVIILAIIIGYILSLPKDTHHSSTSTLSDRMPTSRAYMNDEEFQQYNIMKTAFHDANKSYNDKVDRLIDDMEERNRDYDYERQQREDMYNARIYDLENKIEELESQLNQREDNENDY